MGSKWNSGCSCGQCAICNNNGLTGSDTSVDCCDTCGLNTANLGISATSSGQHSGSGCSSCASNGGLTGSSTSAECCDTCALTINPDGSSLVSNHNGSAQRRNLRAAVSNTGCRQQRCRAAVEYTPCAANNDGCASCGHHAANQNDQCHQCENACGKTCQQSSCQGENRQGGCASCGKANNMCTCGCNRNADCHSASVFHQEQMLNETFATEDALFQGTLFPELNKPMNAAMCHTDNCATRRQLMAFEAWELRLYLNTHPNDQCALKRWQQLCSQCGRDNYATAFTGDCNNGGCWQWITGPWPWEYQACGKCNCKN